MVLDYVFGCRSPTSKYAWDGAFVVTKARGENGIIGAIFEKGADFIGHPTYAEAVATYKYNMDIGWHPMDIDDLVKTAIDRKDIDDKTVLVPIDPSSMGMGHCIQVDKHASTPFVFFLSMVIFSLIGLVKTVF